ncbi:MAG: DNA-3-methyladenine glycosylase [Candidatus Azambacteria bacterium]|nr:DNA-3-methyladenine glycosylase [Candidatus Azambacteria bacterium]
MRIRVDAWVRIIIMSRLKKLAPAFFQQPTLDVARSLLGKYLVVKRGDVILSGKIVETEAYVGEDDLACHASKGRTPRTETLYQKAGTVYVYLVYGMYHCLNIVTEKKGFPSAVLIRAVEPKDGIERMKKNRKTAAPHNLASGPGKVCEAFGITRKMNGESVRGVHIWIEDRGEIVHANDIVAVPRIGIAYAGVCARYPWRFYITDNDFTSRK